MKEAKKAERQREFERQQKALGGAYKESQSDADALLQLFLPGLLPARDHRRAWTQIFKCLKDDVFGKGRSLFSVHGLFFVVWYGFLKWHLLPCVSSSLSVVYLIDREKSM